MPGSWCGSVYGEPRTELRLMPQIGRVYANATVGFDTGAPIAARNDVVPAP